MVTIDLNYKVDLAEPIKPRTLDAPLFYADSQAHRINVEVVKKGIAADLTNFECKGYIVKEETNQTIPFDPEYCSIEDNVASVTLPILAYSFTGRCYIVIRLIGQDGTVNEDTMITIFAAYSWVANGITGNVEVPDTYPLNIETLEQTINAKMTEVDQKITEVNTAVQAANTAASAARSAASHAVVYDSAQTLSASEKKVARANIGTTYITDGWNLLTTVANVNGSGAFRDRAFEIEGCRFSKKKAGTGSNATSPYFGVPLLGNVFRPFTFTAASTESVDINAGLLQNAEETDFVKIPPHLYSSNLNKLRIRFVVNDLTSTGNAGKNHSRYLFATMDGEGNVERSPSGIVYGYQAPFTGFWDRPVSFWDWPSGYESDYATFWDKALANGNFALYYFNTNSMGGSDVDITFSMY